MPIRNTGFARESAIVPNFRKGLDKSLFAYYNKSVKAMMRKSSKAKILSESRRAVKGGKEKLVRKSPPS